MEITIYEFNVWSGFSNDDILTFTEEDCKEIQEECYHDVTVRTLNTIRDLEHYMNFDIDTENNFFRVFIKTN